MPLLGAPLSPDGGDSVAAARRHPREFVNSIAKALTVLRCFDEKHRALTLSEVASRASLTRATARRILLTLVGLGYARSDGRSFELTPRVLGLGYAYLSSMGFADAVRPYVAEASRLAQESSSISVLDVTEIVYVCRVHTERIMSISLGVGTQLPAHVTAMGRVMLAQLPDDELRARLERVRFLRFTPRTVTSPTRLLRILAEIRAQDFAVVEEELEPGLSSIAAPIRDRSGAVVAALNFGGPTARLQGSALTRKYLPLLRDATERIGDSLRLGHFAPR
jgi:IclR family transcriptional regulator, pca regulon regulatory protein